MGLHFVSDLQSLGARGMSVLETSSSSTAPLAISHSDLCQPNIISHVFIFV